jgi:transcriptional regulator with XRE-family HTH domain
MKVPLSELPSLLKSLRIAMSLTQSQAAELLGPGYSKGHISYIEAGKRPVGIELLKRFGKIYGTEFYISVE